MSQRQCVHSLPSHTYYGTYVPCSSFTHSEYPALQLTTLVLVTGGVVLPCNTYGEDFAGGRDIAIVIASLTQHYPLEPSCLNTHTHSRRNQCNNIRSHWLELNNVSNLRPILYIESSTGCGFLLSRPCVSTPNVHSDVWDCVESYVIHMILACGWRIISKSHKNPVGATTQPHFPSLDSHSSQVRVSSLLFLFLPCCISSLGRKAYCTIAQF